MFLLTEVCNPDPSDLCGVDDLCNIASQSGARLFATAEAALTWATQQAASLDDTDLPEDSDERMRLVDEREDDGATRWVFAPADTNPEEDAWSCWFFWCRPIVVTA